MKGPHLLIFGAIHGNEVCGPRALSKLIAELDSGVVKLQRGTLTLVPVCNLKAFDQNERFVEENLNRVFERHSLKESLTYERGLANLLTPFVEECDVFLDLHSMQSDGEEFAVLNSNNPRSEALCLALGTKFILSGWNEVFKVHPSHLAQCTQTFADKINKPNALIECGTHGTEKADQIAYVASLRALSHLGLLESAENLANQNSCREIKLRSVFFRESIEDRFEKTWSNFETVKSGQIIGYRRASATPVHSSVDGFIVFPSPVSAVGTEWFYLGVE